MEHLNDTDFLEFPVVDEGGIITLHHAGFEYHGSESHLTAQGIPTEVIQAALLAHTRQQALATVKTQHAQALKQLSGDATVEERDTWPVQLAAAQAEHAGTANPAQQAMLDALLVADESRDALVLSILQKDQAVQTLIGLAGGLKRSTESALHAAESVTEIADILAQAQTRMAEAMVQFKQAVTAGEAAEEAPDAT